MKRIAILSCIAAAAALVLGALPADLDAEPGDDSGALAFSFADVRAFIVSSVVWEKEEWFAPFGADGRFDDVLVQALGEAGVPEDDLTYLKDEGATRAAIREALGESLAASEDDETLLLYFQGHGSRDSEGATFFVPYDIDGGVNDEPEDYWAVTDVFDAVQEQFKGDQAILIADCCYAGALIEEARRREAADSRIAFACFGSSLANIPSTVNWTFTECIVDALRGSPRIDLDDDGAVELNELGEYAERTMAFEEGQLSSFATTGAFDATLTLSAVAGDDLHPWIGMALEGHDDDDWFRAVVTDVDEEEGVRIHYIGFDEQWDQWRTLDQLRAYRPPAFPIDAHVEVEWRGEWYEAVILDQQYGLHEIHYVGDSDDWDEWVAADRIRAPEADVAQWDPEKTFVFAVGILEWESDAFGTFPKENRQDQVLIDTLEELGVPEENVTLLLDDEATLEAIESGLAETLSSAGEDSLLLVYYAGHGSRGNSGTVSFVPYDATSAGAVTYWQVPDLFDAIEGSFVGPNVILTADCCYSGGLAEEARRRARRQRRDGDDDSGISYACLASSQASTTSTGNWTFTEALIAGLSGSGRVDQNRDGDIVLGEIAAHAETEMALVEQQLTTFSTTRGFAPLRLRDASAAPTGFVGELLEVESEGEWYVARVLEAKDLKLKVHYFGWESRWDELVPLTRVRPVRRPTYPAGTAVDVSWNGTWYSAHVLDTRHGLHQITYDDYDAIWNEWVSQDRIRPRE